MKPAKLIAIVAVFVIIIAVFFFASRNQPGNSGSAPRNSLQDTQNIAFQSQTDEQGEVVVEVTPIELIKNAPVWKFQVVQNTHSVELGADMAKSSVLVDDSGREYPALSWEGAPSGGHHRQGILSFAPITPTPKFVEIRISGIGGIESRSFKWQLNN
ncbi:MAG: hypothetical protein Q8N81_02780 [bacterium]|nr:hypothetical protein [bacterium]